MDSSRRLYVDRTSQFKILFLILSPGEQRILHLAKRVAISSKIISHILFLSTKETFEVKSPFAHDMEVFNMTFGKDKNVTFLDGAFDQNSQYYSLNCKLL